MCTNISFSSQTKTYIFGGDSRRENFPVFFTLWIPVSGGNVKCNLNQIFVCFLLNCELLFLLLFTVPYARTNTLCCQKTKYELHQDESFYVSVICSMLCMRIATRSNNQKQVILPFEIPRVVMMNDYGLEMKLCYVQSYEKIFN